MLVTEVKIKLKAGDGGNGRASFYKKGRRGPDGGNGGKGGDIFLTGDRDIYLLGNLIKHHSLKAESGKAGMRNKKTGRDGQNLVIKLPLGSVITELNSGYVFEIKSIEDCYLICRGGQGGLGNYEFRSSVNTTPLFAEKGELGEEKDLHINLKLIADFGLIGLPNSGKSSLLKELTAAKPKIADYPFTTLEPNLGVLNNRIIADIPGLIKGASKGKGLGFAFLKHIERVSLLLHCVSVENKNLLKTCQLIMAELKAYNPSLVKKKQIILLTKTDLIDKKELDKKTKTLKSLRKKIFLLSIYDWQKIKELKKYLEKLN